MRWGSCKELEAKASSSFIQKGLSVFSTDIG